MNMLTKPSTQMLRGIRLHTASGATALIRFSRTTGAVYRLLLCLEPLQSDLAWRSPVSLTGARSYFAIHGFASSGHAASGWSAALALISAIGIVLFLLLGLVGHLALRRWHKTAGAGES